MPFKEGNNLSTGRPKGSLNKQTKEIKQAFSLLLSNNLADVQDWINALEPEKKLKVIFDLASYVIPRQKASDITINEPFKEQPLFLSEDQIEEMKNISDEAFTKVSGRSSKSCIDGFED